MNSVESLKPSQGLMKTYLEVRSWVEQGLYEKASLRLRLMRSSSASTHPHLKFLRALVAVRMSIKSAGGRSSIDERDLDPTLTTDPFLKAEAHFVRGLFFYHRRSFKPGLLEFQSAERIYKNAVPHQCDLSLISCLSLGIDLQATDSRQRATLLGRRVRSNRSKPSSLESVA